jgi:stage III sporulation protein AH
MKILKRNQLIVLVISLMLVTAGYLNFTSTNQSQNNSAPNLASLGDATLVSSNTVEIENKEQNQVPESTDNKTDETVSEEPEISQETSTKTDTVKTVEEDTYFTTSKLERENMYSQMLETYQEIYNNTNSTPEQKNTAMQEIAKVNETKNAIMIAENLVKAKGFKDIVIFENSNSTSVIIKADKLEPEQIAQIQNIISRELEVGAEQISISTK